MSSHGREQRTQGSIVTQRLHHKMANSRQIAQWMRMLWKKMFWFESEINLNLPHCLLSVVSVAQNGESRRFGSSAHSEAYLYRSRKHGASVWYELQQERLCHEKYIRYWTKTLRHLPGVFILASSASVRNFSAFSTPWRIHQYDVHFGGPYGGARVCRAVARPEKLGGGGTKSFCNTGRGGCRNFLGWFPPAPKAQNT